MDADSENPAAALVGRTVWMVCIDYQFRLVLPSVVADDPPSERIEVVIGTPFVYHSPTRERYTLDPEAARRLLAPVLDLFSKVVSAASVSAGGSLRMTFEDGARLIVDPNPGFEAWQLVGPGERMLVCLPGGNRAVRRD